MLEARSVAGDAPARRRRPALSAGTAQTYGAGVVLALLFLFNAVFTNNFLTKRGLVDIQLRQVAPIAIVAVGMALVIATAGIDLSVGSLMAISGSLAALVFLHGAPTLVALSAGIAAAAACGVFNGTLVAAFRIQPIIATLVLFIAGRGIAQVITNGRLQDFNDSTFQYVGSGRPLGIPMQVVLMVLVVAAAAYAVRSTAFGRYVLAVGGNEAAARLAGVPVARVKLVVYTISGALAGLAGLVTIAINSSSDANQVGLGMELDAIAAVAVGGTPLTGGRVTMVGTLIGALIMKLLQTTMISHGVSSQVAHMVEGVVIVVAVYVQRRTD